MPPEQNVYQEIRMTMATVESVTIIGAIVIGTLFQVQCLLLSAFWPLDRSR